MWLEREGMKILLPYLNHPHEGYKGLLSPTLTLILDNELIYVDLSCPWANIIKLNMGTWCMAHHRRMPEAGVCELCVTTVVRYTQEGQADTLSSV